MIMNSETLGGIYVSFKTIFNKALHTTEPLWEKVATEVPSSTRETNYAWMGAMPSLRKWIGAKQIKNLAASSYTIVNDDFEATVGVSRNDIADDNIGVYNPVVQDMGQAAALWPDGLVFGLMKNGFTEKCYDGKTFYAADHKTGKLTFSNKGTKKLTVDSYGAARAAMMSLKNEEGESLDIFPDLLVVPPGLEGVARQILLADQINGTTNLFKGTAELLVVPRLAGADTQWHLLCTKKAIKPYIFQKREAPKFVAKDKPDDDNVFFNKQLIYGAEARGNAGYAFWQLAYGSTGTTD